MIFQSVRMDGSISIQKSVLALVLLSKNLQRSCKAFLGQGDQTLGQSSWGGFSAGRSQKGWKSVLRQTFNIGGATMISGNGKMEGLLKVQFELGIDWCCMSYSRSDSGSTAEM